MLALLYLNSTNFLFQIFRFEFAKDLHTEPKPLLAVNAFALVSVCVESLT